MVRKVLWIAILSLSLAAFAQVSAPPTQDNALPAGYGAVQSGGVVLYTPNAGFNPTPTTAGISDSGRAGISNSVPLNSGTPGSVPPGTYLYMPYAPAAPESPAPAPASGEPAMSNLLPSYATNNVGTPVNGNGPSLAEFAARYGRGTRLAAGKQSVRTYTNADVPQENAGLLTNVLAAEGRLPADAQRSPQLMASATMPTPPAAQAQSSVPAATDQAPSGNPRSQLPASASPLPLLGLLGLFSGGVGLLLRRKR